MAEVSKKELALVVRQLQKYKYDSERRAKESKWPTAEKSKSRAAAFGVAIRLIKGVLR